MPRKKEQWLTIGEAASLIGVSQNTLRNWDSSGKLRAKRHPLNNYRLYRETDVLKLRRILDIDEERTYEISPSYSNHTGESFTHSVKQLNRLYRDHDLDLMTRFEEISKIVFCKYTEDTKARAGYEKAFDIRPGDTEASVFQRISKLYADSLPEGIDNRGGIHPSYRAVYDAVSLLGPSKLTQYDEDVKGTTYEEMIRNTFEGDENQQYFTPRPLVEFMVELVNPQLTSRVCDPACGTGGFLITTLKKLSRDLKLEGAEDAYQTIYDFSERNLVGIEIDSRIAWIAQMNCYSHGGSPRSIHHLPKGGSLAYDNGSLAILADESQDIIITNPPFGSDYTDEKNLAQYTSGRGKKSMRRGVLFVERCLRALRPGGKLAIIIDDGILNSASNEAIRRVMINQSIVLAVFSLPEDMFKPYASVKSSVLLLKKKGLSEEEQPPIFMTELRNVGRRPNGSPHFTDERNPDGSQKLLSDFPHAIEMWQRFQLGRNIAHTEESQSFVTELELGSSNPIARLDTVFHHPSKEFAKQALRRSVYPVYALSDLFRLRKESMIPSKSCPDDDILYLGLADIEKETGQHTIRRVKGSKIKSTVRRFDAGDILFSKMRPHLRKVIIAQETGYCSSECLVLQGRFQTGESGSQKTLDQYLDGDAPSHHEMIVNPEFVGILLRSNLVHGQIVRYLTGIGRPRVPARAVMKIRIPIPPIDKQQSLVRQFKRQQDASTTLRRQSEHMLREAKRLARSAHEEVAGLLGAQDRL